MRSRCNQPHSISQREWREIINLPEVQELWGLTDETAEQFSNSNYGVKFDYVTGGPDYSGDIFLLMDDALGAIPPIVLGRNDGKLEVFEP